MEGVTWGERLKKKKHKGYFFSSGYFNPLPVCKHVLEHKGRLLGRALEGGVVCVGDAEAGPVAV